MGTNYWPQLSLSINPSSSSSSSSLISWGSTVSPPNSAAGDAPPPPPPPQDSEKTGKRSSTRRRETWTRDTISLEDDGFQWRKYGEKVILGQPYPRAYFRCSYRYDQGCLATKQVQRIGEDPPIYRTTYIHHHTCERPVHHHDLHQIITTHDSFINPTPAFDLVIRSESKIVNIGNRNSKIYSDEQKNKRQESKKSVAKSSSPDCNMGKDLRLSVGCSDTEGVYSYSSSSSSSSSSSFSAKTTTVAAIAFDPEFSLRL